MPDNVQEQHSNAEKQSKESQQQVYDNVIKRLIEGQFAEIIPLLFSTLKPVKIEELTVEALLPPRRMDRVYRVRTDIGEAILHIEIEMAPKGREQTSRRMLIYHALFLEKYGQKKKKLPIITLVLYPFEVPGGEPVLIETYGDEEILRFYYREMSLRTLDASTFVQKRSFPLYGFLPAMGGVSGRFLLDAIEDMVNYYKGDKDSLTDELLCFRILLQRTKSLSESEVETVLRRLSMYDPLLEEDPWVQEYGGRQKAEGIAEGEARGEARGEAKGKAEGKAEGRVEAIRQSIEMLVQVHFCSLLDLATERVERIEDTATLQQVLLAMSRMPDENKARRYLQSLRSDK